MVSTAPLVGVGCTANGVLCALSECTRSSCASGKSCTAWSAPCGSMATAWRPFGAKTTLATASVSMLLTSVLYAHGSAALAAVAMVVAASAAASGAVAQLTLLAAMVSCGCAVV